MSCSLQYIVLMLCAEFATTMQTGGQYDLVRHLFTNYSKSVKPSVNGQPSTVTSYLNPALYNVIQLNGNLQQLTYTIWYRLDWIDPLLSWDPVQFYGIDVLKIPTRLVWMPDVTATDITDVINEMPPNDIHVVKLESNGRVTYAKTQTVVAHCDLFLRFAQDAATRFPFDQQNCSILYGSWLYHEGELAVYPKQPADALYYKESTEWTLVSYTARNSSSVYGTDTVGVSDVVYDIVIKRKSFFYVANYTLPTFAITLLTIIGLFSPFNNLTERQEKVTMGLTALLTISVMLLKIQTDMPTSDNVPLLGLYEMLEMTLAGVATICAVLVMYLDNSLAVGKVPKWFYKIITHGMHLDDVAKQKDAQDLWAQKVSDAQPYIQQSETKEMQQARPIDLGAIEVHVNGIFAITSLIKARLTTTEQLETTRKRGLRICRQMDDYMMAAFIVVDVLLTAAFLIFGYCFT